MTRRRKCAFLDVLGGTRRTPVPIWFMRQAGRYLPEYRKLRQAVGSFLDLVYRPEAAAEATLQPVRRFGLDAAILFSDILVIPHALGQELTFEKGEGPVLAALEKRADLARLDPERAQAGLAPIYETVRLVRKSLPESVGLIGFAGGPWTVASYMVAGRGGDEQRAAKMWAYRDPEGFDELLRHIEAATIEYLLGQVGAGADAIQIFESWAGNLPQPWFERLVVAPTRRIVKALKAKAADVPVIGFARGAGAALPLYVRTTGVDAVSLDTATPLDGRCGTLPARVALQGNLDPVLVCAGGGAMLEEARRILIALRERPHVFNLGHGFLPETPVDHVTRLVAFVREESEALG